MRMPTLVSAIRRVELMLWLFVTVACVGSGTTVSAAEIRPQPTEPLTLLRERRFVELDALLAKQQQTYEADPSREADLERAFQPFHTVENLEPLLSGWIAASPTSYVAHLARGSYYGYRGWDARGEKYINETPRENIREMERWFDKALADFELSLKLTAKPLLSYAGLIGIGQARGWNERKRRWIDEANNVAPSNLVARRAYLVSLRPQWGGSIVEMTAFVESSAKHLTPDDRRHLESYVWRAKGRVARNRGDKRTAAQHYTKSLELYDGDGEMYIYRGWMYADLGQQADALRDFNRGLEIRPDDAHGYRRRGALLLKMGEYERALDDSNRALALKPDDAWTWGNRGYVHERRGRLEQAFADYQKAAQRGDAWSQNRLGEYYWHGRATAPNRQQAIHWWKTAAEKGNRDAQHHLQNEGRQP